MRSELVVSYKRFVQMRSKIKKIQLTISTLSCAFIDNKHKAQKKKHDFTHSMVAYKTNKNIANSCHNNLIPSIRVLIRYNIALSPIISNLQPETQVRCMLKYELPRSNPIPRSPP